MQLTTGKGFEGNEGAMVLKDGSVVSRKSIRNVRNRSSISPHGRRWSMFNDNRSPERKSSVSSEENMTPIKSNRKLFHTEQQDLNEAIQT